MGMYPLFADAEEAAAERAKEVARKLSDGAMETIRDIYRCPGLFAGQYDRIEAVPRDLYEVRYEGMAGMLGLASETRLTDLGIQVIGEIGEVA